MFDMMSLIIGMIIGALIGYFYAKMNAYRSVDLSQQSSMISGLTTQIAEMKGKFVEIEKSRDKLDGEREKRIKDILEASKKSDDDKEKRIKEIIDSNYKFFEEQGKNREELEKQRDAQIKDMRNLISSFTHSVSGTKKRGLIGENILAEALQNSIRANVVKKDLKVGSQSVEFGWNLGDGKFIPIDSKLPDIFSLFEQYEATEDADQRKGIIKKVKDTVSKEISVVQKYQNQSNTIDTCILVVPPAILDMCPELVGIGQESNVFVCSYKDVFPIAHLVQEQYLRFKEEGDIGQYKQMIKAMFALLDNIVSKTESIDRAVKQIANANDDIKDQVAKGKRL